MIIYAMCCVFADLSGLLHAVQHAEQEADHGDRFRIHASGKYKTGGVCGGIVLEAFHASVNEERGGQGVGRNREKMMLSKALARGRDT